MPRSHTSLERAVRGRTVLVTGASSGIGRAVALTLGSAGASVLLVARRRDALEQAQREIERLNGVAHVHPCDLSDPLDIDRMAAEVLDQHGHVDVVVNNAGRSIRRALSDSYDRFHDFQRTMALNYFGAVRLILDLLPSMRERGCGQIVNISTAGVQTSAPMYSAYLASKAAVDAFARSLAFEVRNDGIAVSTVYMPLVRTPMITPTKAYEQWPALTTEQAAAMVCTAIRTRRARVSQRVGVLAQIGYAIAPGSDHAINRWVARIRFGRRWRTLLRAGTPDETRRSAVPMWEETFRHRIARTAAPPADPDEIQRLARLLRRAPLFARCSVRELHALAAASYPVAFEPGEVLCEEGADTSDCYVVVEGEASVRVRGRQVARVGADEVVGERGPIEGRARSATVVAITRLLVYGIPRAQLDSLLATNADAAEYMRHLVHERYRNSDISLEAPAAPALQAVSR